MTFGKFVDFLKINKLEMYGTKVAWKRKTLIRGTGYAITLFTHFFKKNET